MDDRIIRDRPSPFSKLISAGRDRLGTVSGTSLVRSATPAALRLGGAVLQFVATLLIARTLGASRSGDFFFWSSVFRTTGQATTFGLDRLALRQVPRMEDSPGAVSAYCAPVRVAILLLACVAAGLVIGYALLLNPDPTRPGWWYLLPPACIGGVALCMFHGDIMNGRGRPVVAVLYRHTLPTAAFVVALVFAVRFATTDQLLACFALTFAAAGLGALLGPGFRGDGPYFRLPTVAEFKDQLKQGSPIFLCSAFHAFTFMVPLALLEWHHPSDQIAYFTTAYRIFVLFEVLSMAVHSLAMPALSKAGLSDDRVQLRRIYKDSVFKGFLFLGPPMLGCLVLAGPVTAIFGDEFRNAGPVLQTLLALGMLSLACGPATSLVLMIGRTGRMATYAFWRFAAAIVLSLFLVPRFGPVGMAAALGVGLLLEKGLCLLHLRPAK
ncbi:MAG: oligosaccharide flippase family protein [Verrucomicrobiales bacterium]